jgi:hypothetical protein
VPGVVVTTAVRSGPAAPAAAESATYFVAGMAERGPTDRAVRVSSLAEYERIFGDPVPYGFLYTDLQTFFEEGGGAAVVARVVGAAATRATVTLADRAADTPVPTLRFDAADEGAWGARVSVVVEGAAEDFTVRVLFDGVEVERYPALVSPAAVVAALAVSTLVRVTSLGSVSAEPTNSPAAGTYPLTGGGDDRAAVTATDVVEALDRFTDLFGTGVMAVPGYPASQVGTGLMAAARRWHRVFLTSAGVGALAAQARAQAAALSAAGVPSGAEYGGLVWPSIRVPTGRTITPEGYVAACRARAITEAGGPWQAPAGQRAVTRWVLGTDQVTDSAVGNDLDAARVNVIRTIAGATELYGWRSLHTDDANYGLLTGRDVLNIVHREAEARLEQFVFSTVDSAGRVLSQVQAELVGLLEPMAVAGGLYRATNDQNQQVDPGYLVDVGPGVNTPQTLAANMIRAALSLRIAPVATMIELTITKAAANASL